MNPNQLKVGSIYRLGGKYRVLKRITYLNLADVHLTGGKVKTVNASTSGGQEIWSADFFAREVIEVVKDATSIHSWQHEAGNDGP